MSNSPLNHKKRRGISGLAAGLFGRKNRGNSNPNDPNNLNKLQTMSQGGGMFGTIGKLALQQQGAGDAVNNANEMQQEALGSVENTGVVNPIDIQKEQVAQASGLSALTQGPTGTPGSITAPPVESGTLADRDYNTLMGGLNKGSAFAMKSPLKQNGSTFHVPTMEDVSNKNENENTNSGEYTNPKNTKEQIDVFAQPPNADAISAIDGNSVQSEIEPIPEKTERLQGKIDALDKSGANPAKLARLKGRLDRTQTRQSARAERIEGRNINKKQRVVDYQKMRNDDNYGAIDFIKDRFKKKNKNVPQTNSQSEHPFGMPSDSN